ncbi:MAG: insulinase family protein [Desulfobulbaceae bacterium]|nr:insulinase family protein [Desulfobulbaceae bacterium]
MAPKTFFRTLLFLTLSLLALNMNNVSALELSPLLFKNTLENGLTTLVKETPGTRAVTVQIWVKTGSAYEEKNEAGITHLIEHMIFKGTTTRKAGEVAGAIEEVGGNVNAYTYYDYTVYHATLSARHWELALEVLTDAVENSTFDAAELEREKKVVLEEIAMREDRPQTLLNEKLMARSYLTHPYRLPIIGTRESVSSFSREDILRYVEKHYQPENFTVVVVGDVRAREVSDRVRQLLGNRPRGGQTNPSMPKEAVRDKADFFTMTKEIKQTHLVISLPITPFDHPDTPVLDVIAALLGQGETSRLYHQLRDQKGLVYRIGASAFTPKDQGLMEIFATLDNTKVEPALAAILDELSKLKYQPVEDDELARVKRNLESDFIFGMEQVEGQARIMGSFEFLAGDPREDEYLSRVRSVSKEDILRVAATYFRPEGLTVGLLTPAAEPSPLTTGDLEKLAARAESLARDGVPSALLANAYLPGTYQYRLRNGLRLVVREDPRVETVAIRAVMPGGLRGETIDTNGAFAFISALLPKSTEKMTSRELAVKIADLAGTIEGFNGNNTFGLNGDFLARFFSPGLELVRDILRTPAFAPEEAEKIRPERLAQLKQQDDSLPSLAFLRLNENLFQGHPYSLNPVGNAATISKLSAAELRGIYEAQARPDRLVLTVAGAVKAQEVRDQVEKLFGDWPKPAAAKGPLTEESLLPPTPPPAPELVKVVRAREQTQIVIGFLGTTLASPDRFPLEILETVLSGQSGRLFSELRDRQSLAYSLSAFGLLGLDTGSFGIYIGTSPDKQEQAIKAIWRELFRIREEPISSEELSKARNLLISQYELGLQTHGAQALDMALNESYGLGQDFGNRYIKGLNAVTPEQVLAVAKKYIQPDHYVMVTAGAEAPPPVSVSETPAAPPPATPAAAASQPESTAPAVAQSTSSTKAPENQ